MKSLGVFDGHEVYFEEPDTVFTKLVGDLSGEQAQRMGDVIAREVAGLPRIFYLSDSSRMGDLSPEARRISVEQMRRLPCYGTASFGIVSFQRRVIGKLMMGAMGLLKQSQNMYQLFTTEAEARAWIAKRRQEVLSRG